MDFNLSKEQKEFRKEIIQFAQKELTDETEEFSPDMWKKCADFGLLGISVEEEYGGLNESYLTSLIAMEAIGYGCKNNGLIFVITNHLWVCQNLISRYGSKEQKDKYLKSMVEGKKIGGFALTESNSGSDNFAMSTFAEKKDGRYILNGTKMYISNGTIADVFVVFAKTSGQDAGLSSITAFIVDKDMPGVTIGTEIDKMGLKACPMAEISFHDCVLEENRVLGKEGSGINVINVAMEWERCFEFAGNVGTMKRIMESCKMYAKKRKQFGKLLQEYQSITNKIADMKVEIEMAELMLYKIGWLKDNNKRSFIESSIFKLFVSENYVRSCIDLLQIFGAYGYTIESGIEREIRDALATTIYAGTSEIQRNIIYEFV